MLAFNAGGMKFLTDGIVFVNCESLEALLYEKKMSVNLISVLRGQSKLLSSVDFRH